MYYFSDRVSTKNYFDELISKLQINDVLKIGAIYTVKQKMLPFSTMQVYSRRQTNGREYASFVSSNKILNIVRVR